MSVREDCTCGYCQLYYQGQRDREGTMKLTREERDLIRRDLPEADEDFTCITCYKLLDTADELEAELAAIKKFRKFVNREVAKYDQQMTESLCDREKAAEQAIIEEAVELIRLRWCPDDSHQIVLDVRSVLKDTFALSRYDDKWKKREKAAIAAARLEEAEWWANLSAKNHTCYIDAPCSRCGRLAALRALITPDHSPQGGASQSEP